METNYEGQQLKVNMKVNNIKVCMEVTSQPSRGQEAGSAEESLTQISTPWA